MRSEIRKIIDALCHRPGGAGSTIGPKLLTMLALAMWHQSQGKRPPTIRQYARAADMWTHSVHVCLTRLCQLGLMRLHLNGTGQPVWVLACKFTPANQL